MGCELGKLASSGGSGNHRKPDESAPPATVDPRLPLTAKQKYNMLASWKGISRAMESTGVCMFLKLFEEHAELLTLFEKFKELKTKEDQANSLELAEHASTVMNTLDEGIKELDNLDTFFEYLHQVGASHRRIPGFKVEYFWKIEKPFLTAVETTLGDRYTENVENIYKITIKFIIETLVKGYDNANAPT
ncbi:neuroglobin [Tribolium castaneum]|uniref:neuroglobin n=1 Tax=Tribolium castaneum TaxID=7070 RepID=UPI00046C2173|nr:PREDICTED: neuroglobin [Tribolium castaneum]XP_015834431.1 PREDICTED: neuroglobin [Tribolium castaneum]XP_015834432.1 PREDICTED: neuroglobin [Tribolium castaneum]|eukprot:XP_008191892.1 PREDICTED: neuroglobin [Tribolium castaneum]